MRRLLKPVVAGAGIALTLLLALPPAAGARTNWVCDVPGEGTVTFVSAGDSALPGITRANDKAGAVFNRQFGEVCSVVPS